MQCTLQHITALSHLHVYSMTPAFFCAILHLVQSWRWVQLLCRPAFAKGTACLDGHAAGPRGSS